jgi:hypothetical protein
VDIITACVAPGGSAGVMPKDSGLAERPVTEGTETVQLTAWVWPLARVATTLGVVLVPAATVVPVGLHAIV